jgi:hypothetical protein
LSRFNTTRNLLLLAAIAAASAIVFLFDPSVTPYYPRCAFHSLTGLQCPGCGGTRAVYQLLHGHVREALRLNAMVFVFGPFFAVAAVRPGWLRRPWVGWAAVWLLLVWGAGRNLLHL